MKYFIKKDSRFKSSCQLATRIEVYMVKKNEMGWDSKYTNHGL